MFVCSFLSRQRKVVKQETSPDQNENRGKRIADTADLDTNDDNDADADTADTADTANATTTVDAKTCLYKHGSHQIFNMRRSDGEVQFQVECKVCNRIEWQPTHIVKRLHPQKVIDFYETCIEWKRG